MNRFIHPRNPYKKRPDFEALAAQFPDELGEAFRDGKFDFSKRENTIALSKCLLKKDFDLDIDFPPRSLAPSLTLKINYILWIQDILQAQIKKCESVSQNDVLGLDVGCGGAILFPALAAKLCQWKMLGSETESSDVELARKNVDKNQLNESLQIIFNEDKASPLISAVQKATGKIDFTMCNPPFYDDDEYQATVAEHEEMGEDQHAGRRHEMSYPGGEVAFVLKMIEESITLRDRVNIFTTMLGKQKSLGVLKKRLRECTAPSPSFTTTEFCQGKTMRWALAWSFDPQVKLEVAKSDFAKSKAKKRGAEPFVVDLDISESQTVKSVHQKIEVLVKSDLNGLDYQCDPVKGYSFRLTNPSWRNQRSKRRKLANGQTDEGDPQPERNENSETLLYVKLKVLQPTDTKIAVTFNCDVEKSSLGRGGLYEVVQYFQNKLKPR